RSGEAGAQVNTSRRRTPSPRRSDTLATPTHPAADDNRGQHQKLLSDTRWVNSLPHNDLHTRQPARYLPLPHGATVTGTRCRPSPRQGPCTNRSGAPQFDSAGRNLKVISASPPVSYPLKLRTGEDLSAWARGPLP